ncbi:MAG: hypothetical protein AAFW75_16870 [Cyanobacteria bacterium J06636_16]
MSLAQFWPMVLNNLHRVVNPFITWLEQMDSDERKRLIFFKSLTNNQRRNRETLLTLVDPALAQTLGSATCIYTPESHDIIANFLPITANGIGVRAKTRPLGYHYAEVAWPQEALKQVQQIRGVDLNTSCYLLITSPNGIRQGSTGYWVPKYPLFVVDFALAKRLIPQLWSVAEHFLAIIGCQLEFGMIIDHYCGYVENDVNPDEIVYEVAWWPANAV